MFCVCPWLCYAILCILSSFAIILIAEVGAGCFTSIVFLVSCDCYCSVALPCDSVGCSAMCDCGMS